MVRGISRANHLIAVRDADPAWVLIDDDAADNQYDRQQSRQSQQKIDRIIRKALAGLFALDKRVAAYEESRQ